MDYHLRPLGKTCAATGEVLRPGSVCYSALVERNGQLHRVDYSEAGWSGPPEGMVGQWKCVVPAESENKPKPLDPQALMRYFEQLAEEANPAQDRMLYIMALLLLQKRRLKLEGSQKEGEIEYLQLIGIHGEGPFLVRDQQLSETEIEELQTALNAHLSTEWN